MIRLITVIFLIAAPLAAQDKALPGYDSIYVNDYADIIDQTTEAKIVQTLTDYRDQTGVELTVLTITSRAEYSDLPSIESFAKALFNEWGIGNAERNDGILMLVAVEDREMRIQLGAGYGPVYDGRMQRIIDSIILPEFRSDNYAYGIATGVDGIIERIDANYIEPEAKEEAEPLLDWIMPTLVFSLFGIAFIWSVFKNMISDGAVRMRRCPNCGNRTLSRTRETLANATYSSSGRRLLTTRCSSCGYRDEREQVIPVKSRSSGGGGSFGGGRSSGGGASGRW